MNKNKEIISKIVSEKERQGISSPQLAKKVGCTAQAIRYWLKGERQISLYMADKLLKTLDISCVIGKDDED